jgi:hypothetical protein
MGGIPDIMNGDRLIQTTGKCDSEFVLLIGRAFLQELSLGKTDEAIAFGRAFLLLIAG